MPVYIRSTNPDIAELPQDKVWCQEVIISTTTRRGDGVGSSDPIRIIVEVFSKDGKFIAEYDPHQKQ